MLLAALFQGPRWLSFEVYDDEVVVGKEHLPQVLIPVVADLRSGERMSVKGIDRAKHCVTACQQLVNGRLQGIRE
jgi:hypothetical protein